MTAALWLFTAVVLVLRMVAAITLPLTGDEAYYWEWSLRPAFGYVDHPPAVAWTIAAFSWLGHSAFAVRAGFVACGIATTFTVADAAAVAARARFAGAASEVPARAAATAAALLNLAPVASLAFVTASPDGPYLLAWAAVMNIALRIETASRSEDGPLKFALGLAVGAALLSRAFAAALAAGMLWALRARPRVLLPACAVTLAAVAPLLLWNAQHGWENIIFTVAGRHVDEGFSVLRPLLTILETAAALGIASLPLMIVAATRRTTPVLPAGMLPLCALFLILSCFERVETYWFLGPYVSLCIAAAVAVSEPATERMKPLLRGGAISAALTLLVLALAAAPLPVYHALVRAVHVRLHSASLFEIYTYAPLAHDVARIAAAHHAVVMTDGYGFSALLDHEAGLVPLVIGYDWQGREARRWVSSQASFPVALFVDKEPLADRMDFQQRLAQACRAVRPGPVLSYTVAGDIPARVYSTTWCLGMRPRGVGILRWQFL